MNWLTEWSFRAGVKHPKHVVNIIGDVSTETPTAPCAVSDEQLMQLSMNAFNKITNAVEEKQSIEDVGRLAYTTITAMALKVRRLEDLMRRSTAWRIRKVFTTIGLDPECESFHMFTSSFRNRIFDALDDEFKITLPRARLYRYRWILIEVIDELTATQPEALALRRKEFEKIFFHHFPLLYNEKQLKPEREFEFETLVKDYFDVDLDLDVDRTYSVDELITMIFERK